MQAIHIFISAFLWVSCVNGTYACMFLYVCSLSFSFISCFKPPKNQNRTHIKRYYSCITKGTIYLSVFLYTTTKNHFVCFSKVSTIPFKSYTIIIMLFATRKYLSSKKYMYTKCFVIYFLCFLCKRDTKI